MKELKSDFYSRNFPTFKKMGIGKTASFFFVLLLTIGTVFTFKQLQTQKQIKSSAAFNPTNATFSENFDGDPTTPQRWIPPGWDFVRYGNFSEAPFENPIPDCNGAQPNGTMADSYEYGVFKCPNHLMMRQANLSYGFAMLTPPALVDFSNGEAIVKWDMSTLSNQGRNWIEMHLVPVQDHILLAAERWGSNRPAREITIMGKEGNCPGTFGTSVFIRSEIRRTLSGNYGGDESLGTACLGNYVTPSSSQYTTLEFHITRTHIKFGIPSLNIWFFDKNIADLGWDKGVLEFGISSYNSHGNEPCYEAGTCPFTNFHFDNLTISPAIPFTIIPGNKVLVNSQTSNQVNFSNPAPANSQLKFTGMANQIEVSFNSGATWQRVPIRPQPSGNPEGDEHPDDYAINIPPSTVQVLFRGQRWWGGDWEARNISLYSFSEASVITPTIIQATPVPSAIPTPTKVPTPIPTSVPTVIPTAMLTAIPTAVPTIAGKVGDLNHDNFINITDLSILLSNWNTNNATADINHDGVVNIIDLSTLLSNWGK